MEERSDEDWWDGEIEEGGWNLREEGKQMADLGDWRRIQFFNRLRKENAEEQLSILKEIREQDVKLFKKMGVSGETILFTLVAFCPLEVLQGLLEVYPTEIDLHHRNKHGQTAICFVKDVEMARFLHEDVGLNPFEQYDDSTYNAFFEQIFQRNYPVVRYFVEKLDPDLDQESGGFNPTRPLELALQRADVEDGEKCAVLLIEMGARSKGFQNGANALHVAAAYPCRPSLTATLCEFENDLINDVDFDGRRPFDRLGDNYDAYVSRNESFFVENARIFFEKGARPTIRRPGEKDITGPFHNAAHKGWVGGVRELLRLMPSANLDVYNEYGNTPLMLAVAADHDEVVKFLLEAGANPEVRQPGPEGKTALDLALTSRARRGAWTVKLLYQVETKPEKYRNDPLIRELRYEAAWGLALVLSQKSEELGERLDELEETWPSL